jgi:hypothetical protein
MRSSGECAPPLWSSGMSRSQRSGFPGPGRPSRPNPPSTERAGWNRRLQTQRSSAAPAESERNRPGVLVTLYEGISRRPSQLRWRGESQMRKAGFCCLGQSNKAGASVMGDVRASSRPSTGLRSSRGRWAAGHVKRPSRRAGDSSQPGQRDAVVYM